MSFSSLIVLSALADVWESCVGQCRRFDSDLFHVFSLPASTIKFIGKNKNGSTRIYIEDGVYYDVANEYEAVLQVLANNNLAVVCVPVAAE